MMISGMIAYPTSSPLTVDPFAIFRLIDMIGLNDRHHPDLLIVFTGICTRWGCMGRSNDLRGC